MKKYFYEDLRALSQPAREIWICDQCSEFGKEIESLMSDREKENFAEEMHRKLRQLTKRWTSWNHKSCRNVNSRKSVGGLLAWEQSTKLLINPVTKTGSLTPEQSILRRFQELCRRLEELHELFTNNILEPLFDFFHPNPRNAKLDNVIMSLRGLLSEWRSLLDPGMIDQTLFSEASSKYLNCFILRGRSYNHDSVIRLVPDLLEKAYLALSLARKWRLLYKEFSITREGTYTLVGSHRISKKDKRHQCQSLESISLLEKQLEEAQSQSNTLKSELEKCSDKCKRLEQDLGFHEDECQRLKIEVNNAKQAHDEIKEKLEKAKKQSEKTSDSLSYSQKYSQVLQQELNTAKIKYCTQKIKLVNAKKRCVTLADQLEKATKDYENLRMEGEISQKKYQMMRTQLENFRKNIITQGSMVDTLQEQCYSLKKELDDSKTRCNKVMEDLNKAAAKCQKLEDHLKESELERKRLQNELERSASKEKLLRRENAELRKTCKAQDLTTDESCSLNTPIDRS